MLGLVIINDPQGVYYGGTIAAPVMKEIFENVLPYLGIEQKAVSYTHLDVGKISISDTILNKKGRLTDEEMEIMKTHTTKGYEIIRGFKLNDDEDVYKRQP